MPKDTIQIPRRVLESLVVASWEFSLAEDELEDFLLTSRSNFIQKMRRLRQAHRHGQLGNWQKLKKRCGL